MARLHSNNMAQARTEEGPEPKQVPPVRLLTALPHRAPAQQPQPRLQLHGSDLATGTGKVSVRVPDSQSPGRLMEWSCLSTRVQVHLTESMF